MIKALILIPFIAVFLLVLAAKTVRVVKDDERLVVFRLGQLLNVYPPGKAILIPFLDQGIKVNVQQFPGWQTMPEDDLKARVLQAAIDKSRRLNP
jgi:regulator of protease activity HflC (stomatin/prohibitin superfamily)